MNEPVYLNTYSGEEFEISKERKELTSKNSTVNKVSNDKVNAINSVLGKIGKKPTIKIEKTDKTDQSTPYSRDILLTEPAQEEKVAPKKIMITAKTVGNQQQTLDKKIHSVTTKNVISIKNTQTNDKKIFNLERPKVVEKVDKPVESNGEKLDKDDLKVDSKVETKVDSKVEDKKVNFIKDFKKTNTNVKIKIENMITKPSVSSTTQPVVKKASLK